MRKERNNFFHESGFNQGYSYNNMMPQIPQMEASSSFYMNQESGMYIDASTRLARLERQVNRLDARVNKLESNLSLVKQTDEIDNNSNMYMI